MAVYDGGASGIPLRMPRTVPPPLPHAAPPPPAIVAPWQSRNAWYHLAAAVAHLIAAAYTQRWMADHWAAHWGAQTVIEAVEGLYDGALLVEFGQWLLMALLLAYLVLGAVQFVATAGVFRWSTHRNMLLTFAWLSVFSPPAGTLAGLHALRHLKAAKASATTP